MKIKLFLTIASAIAVTTTALYFWLREEPLEAAARKNLQACMNGDAATVYRYIPPSEIEMGGVTEENLKQFLLYVRESLAGFKSKKEPEIDEMPGKQGLTILQRMFNSDGDESGYAFSVFRTPEGPKIRTIISRLLASALAAKAVHKTKTMHEPRAIIWADVIEQDLQQLNQTGLTGLVIASSQQEPQFMTWEQYRDYLREKAKPK